MFLDDPGSSKLGPKGSVKGASNSGTLNAVFTWQGVAMEQVKLC